MAFAGIIISHASVFIQTCCTRRSKRNSKTAYAVCILHAWHKKDASAIWQMFNPNFFQNKCMSYVLNADMFVNKFKDNFIDSANNIYA